MGWTAMTQLAPRSGALVDCEIARKDDGWVALLRLTHKGGLTHKGNAISRRLADRAPADVRAHAEVAAREAGKDGQMRGPREAAEIGVQRALDGLAGLRKELIDVLTERLQGCLNELAAVQLAMNELTDNQKALVHEVSTELKARRT